MASSSDPIQTWEATTADGLTQSISILRDLTVVVDGGEPQSASHLVWSMEEGGLGLEVRTAGLSENFFFLSCSNDSLVVVAELFKRLPQLGGPRDVLETLSLIRWPAENAFFRELYPGQYLETHFAVASLPSYGRLYLSRHVVHVSMSIGGWSETKRQFDLLKVNVSLEGRTLKLDDLALTVLLAEDCHRAILDARNQLETTKCFGVPLSILQSRQNVTVPAVLDQCIIFLDQHLDEEGLFRVSGSAKVVSEMVLLCDEGHDIPLDQMSVADVCTLLKRFIGDVPSKVIHFFQSLKSLPANDVPRHCQCIQEHTTPEERALLRHLFHFISRVAAKSQSNKMTAANLAMVFTPVLIDLPTLDDFGPATQFILLAIAETDTLFSTQ